MNNYNIYVGRKLRRRVRGTLAEATLVWQHIADRVKLKTVALYEGRRSLENWCCSSKRS